MSSLAGYCGGFAEEDELVGEDSWFYHEAFRAKENKNVFIPTSFCPSSSLHFVEMSG